MSGVKAARLFFRPDAGTGAVRELPLANRGAYPTRTGARAVADLWEADFPEGLGDIRYWIEAKDTRGNISRSALERIFLA